MKKYLQPPVFRVVLLPLVSVLGTIAVITWPAGHAAFCATIENLVL